MIEIGKAAPKIEAPISTGGAFSLDTDGNKMVVLFFYPRDDTTGCTKEAIEFSSALDEFSQLNTTVVGVSKDTMKSHAKFIEKHGLSVPLISDADGTICEDFGVWVEKNMYGKKFMGIERSTFLIGADGKILNIWRKVKVPGHVDDVLGAVREL